MPFLFPARCVARALVALLATCMLPCAATAAEPIVNDAAPAPVRAALQVAWRQHPTYRATEAQLAAAQARLDAAGEPLYNPELVVDADDEGTDRTATAGLLLTLDLSGKRRVRRDAAAARLTQAEAEARQRRRDFARDWITAWIDLRANDQRMRTGERRLGLVSRAAGLAERQFAADDISGLDRDLALLARDQAQAEQSALAAERAEAEARFRALGGTPEQLASLPAPEALPPIPSTLDAATLQRLPEWRIADAQALAADREIVVAQRNRVPDPTVGVRAGRIEFDGGASDNVVGVSLSVPLFVRNSYRAEVVAARAEAAAATAEAERTRIELTAGSQRVVESYAATRTAWGRWRASRGTDVERRASLLERLWREGELSTSDYLLQLNQTLDTALAGADLEARLWRTYTDYLAAAGQLERWAGLEGTP